jgi:hypothetical protein
MAVNKKTQKEVIRKKSELIRQIREDFRIWEEVEPDFDEGYFDDTDVISFLEFLTEKYRNEWVVIDDTQEGGRK